jgi:hypothetical protein
MRSATERSFEALPGLSEEDSLHEAEIRAAIDVMVGARTYQDRQEAWHQAALLIRARSPAAVLAIEEHLGLAPC